MSAHYFPPNAPGLAVMHTTGGPPNDVQVRFIRMDERGRAVVTRDGRSVTYCDPACISVLHNPIRAVPR